MRFPPLVRVTLVTIAAVTGLATLVLFAYALAAARVPQQRATLESLVRAETGLDVRFSELALRLGWYGPEAVFHHVELREPGEAQVLLTAPQLVAGIDLWHMLRSGAFSIGRITLINPDIDLTRPLAGEAAHGVGAGGLPRDPARFFSRWRGTRIDIEGGTLRAAPAGVPVAVSLRRVTLRRAGSDWGADAQLLLPQSLGAAVHAVASLHAASSGVAGFAGSATLTGSGLDFAGWHALLAAAPVAVYLPAAGSGDLTMQLELAQGAVARVRGTIEAVELSWPSAAAPAADFALERLRADWHLTRSENEMHLSLAPRAAVQLRLAGLALAGEVRVASLDWSAAEPPGERLHTGVEFRDLSITTADGLHTLAGLSGRVSGSGAELAAEVHSSDAHLTLRNDPDFALDGLGVDARLTFGVSGPAWRVSTRALEIRSGDARLALSATLTGESVGTRPRVAAHATLAAVPVEMLRRVIGAPALATLGPAAAALTGGRITHAELVARGPLDQPLPWSGARQEFAGALELTGATLTGTGDWPELDDLDAHIDWRGSHIGVRVAGARSQGLHLTAMRGEWRAADAGLRSLTGRLEGPAEDALAWLRAHPELAAGIPGLSDLGLTGETLIDLDVRRVARGGARAAVPRYATRLTALLDGARLRPVAGLPGIEALRGTLAFAGGRLQRSTVTGQWLGGPIALSIVERREQDAAVLAIAGRGLLSVRAALSVAGGVDAGTGALEGNAEWNADLRVLPAADAAGPRWRVRADSTLVGVTSRLPEPFAKEAGSALPLHLELAGSDAAGELRVALGERLRGVAALRRRGELWQIERGAIGLAGDAPTLPAAARVRIEGSIERLDLPSYLALWRSLARDPAWPALSVDLEAAELRAGQRSFADVRIGAKTGVGVDQLRLESADLDALVRFPPSVDVAHPVTARLERLDLAQLDASVVGAAAAAALGPAVRLNIADLAWQGRSLGALGATLVTRASTLEVQDLRLDGAAEETRGALECTAARCHATFALESRDTAATLAQLGFRSDVEAAHAGVSGELAWPAATGPSLTDVSGRVRIELTDGLTRSPAAQASEHAPLGLLAVPGLVAGMGLPELRFARLSADFAVNEGQAVTRDLHLDGDTEILLQGRVGLVARDYDARAWVLKGEERLPAAVRALRPSAGVAALWMSLRDLFGGAEHEHGALRLRGTWDDPMVTPP